MKRFISLGVAALATLAFVAAATGASSTTPPTPATYGPYPVATTDGGCGGNQWANDTISRTFVVTKVPGSNPTTTWRLVRQDPGTFITMAGLSPGNCASNATAHDSTVLAGVTGNIFGKLDGVVTGGTYDPAATCTGDCGSTTTFVSTYFGPSAQYSCLGGPGDCTFVYKYQATSGQHLTYKAWVDQGSNAGETFTGDISN